ncbi:hypothetical protein FQN54_004430 [Arachnomyces sp. PD_36]|nr:hypothetical protein FQN54_004430 [Arachnomyces sp. PD_36]
MANPSASLSIASADENQSLTLTDLETLLKQHAKYKERSYQTSKEEHVSFLEGHPTRPNAVLFGDSMLERMKTTGDSENFQPWPSAAMLSDSALEELAISQPASELKRMDGVFNAGVGGDKIENMLYRLLGDPDKGLTGLIPLIKEREMRFWVVHAGTNNLHPKRGHRDKDSDLLRLLLQTLLKISHPEVRILLTELFYRKDIPNDLVDKANVQYRSIVSLMNTNLGREVIVLLPAPKEVSKDNHLDDHVHLNLEGYQLWAKVLAPKAMIMYDQLTKAKG